MGIAGFDVRTLSSCVDAGPEGRAVAELLTRWSTPQAIQVGGRVGVGKSAVISALGDSIGTWPLSEVHGVDSPDHPDPTFDAPVLVYVVAGSAHRADVAALAGRDPGSTLVVLAKADTLADPGEDHVAAVRTAVAAVREATGCPVVPFSSVSPENPQQEAVQTAVIACVERTTVRRDLELLDGLERLAARTPALREQVETFLRQPAATDRRRSMPRCPA